MERDADRADIGARSAKRACVGKFGVGLGIATRFEDRSDRPRNRCAVAMSAAASVDRASVETSATADAGEGVAKGRLGEEVAAAVVDDDDMHRRGGALYVVRFARSTEMRGVGRDGLAGGRSGEQPKEGREVAGSRDDLLKAYARDV